VDRNGTNLDALDELILKELQIDGRASFRVIGKKLKISDKTVRSRVDQMIEAGLLKISPIFNPFFFKDSIVALIGMQLERRTQMQTMKEIASLDGVVSVQNVSGQFDLFVEVFLRSREELNIFLFEVLAGIEGILHTHTFISFSAQNKWMEVKFPPKQK
jgi:DNA-binding Lrp family transcriptional regulator